MVPWILYPGKALSLFLGAVADAIIGDPPHLPHPVRLMGLAIARGEHLARSLPLAPRIQGLIFCISLLSLSGLSTAFFLWLFSSLNPYFGFIFEAVLIYYGLCARSLIEEVLSVAKSLKRGSLPEARKRLSYLVSRQTEKLPPEGIARGAIETVAENLIDGLISPLFYLALGGPPLLYIFKMASTLDSMIGYRDKKYQDFGWAAAKIDDLFNYLPARLGVLLISLAAVLLIPQRAFRGLTGAFKEARYHLSPNAGLPEAAYAWILGVSLAGPTIYGGNLVKRPFFNASGDPPGVKEVIKACLLTGLTYILTLSFLLYPGLIRPLYEFGSRIF
ncbi:adenosylcobinamide-phosphate synthase CbiB [Thermosulfuriphilus sp.]